MTSQPSVLLVADDSRIADAIRRILGDGGFTALDVVDTADRAEVQVRSARPDLILVNLGLPDRDGTDLIRSLRARAVRGPILVVTSATASDRVVAALRSGADGYLFKEDLDARLASSLRELMGGGSPMSSGAARALLDELRYAAPASSNDVALTLTRREAEVLDGLSSGASYADIGYQLRIEINTVRTHIRKLYDKLGVQNRAEAVNYGWSSGLLRRRS